MVNTINDETSKLIEALVQLLKKKALRDISIFIEGEVSLLFLLANSKTSFSPTEISNQLGISKGRVTYLINSLIEKEYVDIEISQEDRRSFNVRISDSGREFLAPKIVKAEKYFSKVFSIIGEEKTAFLVSIINEIKDVLEESENELCNF